MYIDKTTAEQQIMEIERMYNQLTPENKEKINAFVDSLLEKQGVTDREDQV